MPKFYVLFQFGRTNSYILRLVYRPSVRSVIDILLKKRLMPPLDCIAKCKYFLLSYISYFLTIILKDNFFHKYFTLRGVDGNLLR